MTVFYYNLLNKSSTILLPSRNGHCQYDWRKKDQIQPSAAAINPVTDELYTRSPLLL